MSPHVPLVLSNVIAAPSPTTDAHSHTNDRSSTTSHHSYLNNPPSMTSPTGTDKKRGRPLEEPSRSRKKIASELMAFEFESLSLSNGGEAALQDTFKRSDTEPRLHPPVQSVQARQEPQQQPNREPQLQRNSLAHPQQEQPVQPQRSRAKSSPPGSCTLPQHFIEADPSQGAVAGAGAGEENQYHGTLSTIPPPTAELHEYDHFGRSSRQHSQQPHVDPGVQLLPASVPSPPSVLMGTDMAMMAMDEVPEVDGTLMATSDQKSTDGSSVMPTPNVKVLNIRQRKWNSVSKEWQEWQEVQATHTPNIPPPLVHTHHNPHTNIGSNLGHNGVESGPFMNTGASNQWTGSSGKAVSTEGTSAAHSQSSKSLERQQSSRESGGKSKLRLIDEHASHDQRSVFGARARSYSETNINPYTHHHQQPNQHQQDDPYILMNSHSQSESSSTPYQGSSSRRATITATQVEFAHQQHHRQAPMHHSTQPHFGHPARHHSDHVYSHRVDHWEQNGNQEAGHSRHTLQQQAHSDSGTINSQHPWTGLSMATPAQSTINASIDQFSRPDSGSSGSIQPMASSSSSSTRALHGFQHEDQSNWNQQLLESQNVYREGYEVQRSGYGRSSPHHYTQPHQYQYQQHGNLEDVAMGEEIPRPIPSRSSSPAPCLSMVPPVTRPLSISFSQLSGPNMLGNLSEHEQDDDMEL